MDQLIENLRAVLGSENVINQPDELLVYECDGLPQHKHRPRAVVFPSTTEETSEVMRVLAKEGVPFTPRGAGTGLSGGALALNHGVVIEMARMRKILKIDEANRLAVVQPGVVNLHVSQAVASLGLHYVPDPSSQPTCTIGGNIAESAGGIHCLKYGTTTDHVLGLRVVLAGGEVVDLGGAGTEQPGYDLLGVFIGSEGTFGIVTEATLRLVQIPPTVRTLLAEFAAVNAASHAVSAIIASGVMPAALEMMDREIIRAVEASVFAAGLPLDVGAALLIELDGIEAGIDDEAERVKRICLEYGARACRSARDENERKKLWAARKGAFGAIGRISPDSMIQDAVVPRSRLPEVLDDAYRIAAKYQLRIANVFHAGDGNLHPLICFDSRSAVEVHNVKEAGRELMETCVRAGGSITGEHGVGFDKRELLPLIFSDDDMDVMLRVRAAFDPQGLCNPGKIIPMLRGCGEANQANLKSIVQSPKSKSLVPQEAAFGPGGVSAGARASRPHSPRSPGSFDLGRAQQQIARLVGEANTNLSNSSLVVTPGSIDEVCEVMRLASSEGWTVLPVGAMTWLHSSMGHANVLVSTQRLDRIIEHEPADLIALTQSGVTLQDFNATLTNKGQWLPLDPPDDGRATIGGVVATGLAGAQQFGYGPPRKHVIGMKVVTADGRLIKAGGRVVKNVAGYDLCKLFTGSYGTLGIITEVNFKLRPLPFETRSVIAAGSREQLVECGRTVIDSRLFPVAVELLSPGLGAEVAQFSKKNHVLLIRFAGAQTGVADQAKQTLELMKNAQLEQAIFTGDDSTLWESVAALPIGFKDGLLWRAGLRPADLPAFLAELDANGSTSLWHAGIGDGRIRMMERLAEASDANDVEVISRLGTVRDRLHKLGATLIVEQACEQIRESMSRFEDFGSASQITSRVKTELDRDDTFVLQTLVGR